LARAVARKLGLLLILAQWGLLAGIHLYKEVLILFFVRAAAAEQMEILRMLADTVEVAEAVAGIRLLLWVVKVRQAKDILVVQEKLVHLHIEAVAVAARAVPAPYNYPMQLTQMAAMVELVK
jgi:hypothetical protein